MGWGVGGERVVCVTGLITLFFCVGGGGGSCDVRGLEGCRIRLLGDMVSWKGFTVVDEE